MNHSTSIMNSEPTLSREYLQGLVQMKKQAEHARNVEGVVKDIARKITAAAATGASCYLYEIQSLAGLEAHMLTEATTAYRNAQSTLTAVYNIVQRPSEAMSPKEAMFLQTKQRQQDQLSLPPTLAPLSITPEDIVQALKLRCPGCDVSYQEIWVDIAPATRVLKEGVYISWE